MRRNGAEDEAAEGWGTGDGFFGAPRSRDGRGRARPESPDSAPTDPGLRRRDFPPADDPAPAGGFEPRRAGSASRGEVELRAEPREDFGRRREIRPRDEFGPHRDSASPHRDFAPPRRDLASREGLGPRPEVEHRREFGPRSDREAAFGRRLEPALGAPPRREPEPFVPAGELVAAEQASFANAETDFGAGSLDAEPVAPAAPAKRRWLGPSLIAGSVLCSLALVTGVATQFASSACAAPPPAGAARSGEATFFDGGQGNCSYPSEPEDGLFVALGPTEYSNSAACGSYIDVTGPNGSVRVKVVDQCPECDEGHLDLSRDAFARIADPDAGIVDITYKGVANPPVPGPLTVLVKNGSNADYLAVQIDNHGNPLTGVQIGSTALTRTSDNFWEATNGLGGGPFTVEVTDSRGRTATIPGISLDPGEVQRSSVSMSGGAVAPVRTKAPIKAPTAEAKPSQGTSAATGGSAAGESPDAPGSTDSTALADAAAPAAKGTLPATVDPSSSSFLPEQSEAPAASTGRNSCG